MSILLKKKGSLEQRRNTIVALLDIEKEFDMLISKVSQNTYVDYLNKIKDKITYSVNNNNKLNNRELKKLFNLLYKTEDLLDHEILNSKKIKRTIQKIDNLVLELLT